MVSVTYKQFCEMMAAFKAVIIAAVGANGGRPCFVGFELSFKIREKIRTAAAQWGEGKSEEAVETLRNAESHFKRQQVAYLRAHATEKLASLIAELSTKGVENDLLDPARLLLQALDTCAVESKNVDVTKASKDYWVIVDTCEAAVTAQEKRNADRKKAQAQAAKQREQQSEAQKQAALANQGQSLVEQFADIM